YYSPVSNAQNGDHESPPSAPWLQNECPNRCWTSLPPSTPPEINRRLLGENGDGHIVAKLHPVYLTPGYPQRHIADRIDNIQARSFRFRISSQAVLHSVRSSAQKRFLRETVDNGNTGQRRLPADQVPRSTFPEY